ncbi:glycerophosphodiester phosphodiesterase [Emticicia fontis]
MNKILLLLFLLSVTSCEKEEIIFEIDNLNRNLITVLGHGGMGIASTYPMNSFESIANCINLGTDGTEMDVQMTKDGVLVAFHDGDLSTKTDLKGVVNSLTWEQIKGARYNDSPYMTYAVISLEQLFSNIANVGAYRFTFDCKLYRETTDDSAYLNQFADAIIVIAEKYDLQRKICIESNDKEFLKILQSKRDKYRLFIYPESFEEGLTTAKELGIYGITISTHLISAEQIEIAHNQGLRIAVWDTHSDQENYEAVQKNPDFIQTDDVKYLVGLLSATLEETKAKNAAKLDSLRSRRNLPDSTSQLNLTLPSN